MGIKQRSGKTTIKLLVAKYIIFFCIAILLWTCIMFGGQTIGIESGVILTGNYVESHINEYRNVILEIDKTDGERISKDMFPYNCSFAVYDNTGRFLYGDMKPYLGEHEQLYQNMLDKDEMMIRMNHFTKIKGSNNIYIIQYNYNNQFKDPILNKLIPSVEIAEILLFISGFIVILIIVACRLGKKLMSKMQYLNKTILNIQNQNLEFESMSSGIVEIDRIQESLDHMVCVLKESLKKQWDMEMERNEQISALVHDLKTPMTIVKGNVDLMQESYLTIQQKEYMQYIAQGNEEMMHYLEQLLQITRMQTCHTKKKIINTQDFLQKCVQMMTGLLKVKNFNLVTEFNNYSDNLCIDVELMMRALMNVISNAVNYAPENTDIIFKCGQNQSNLEFTIEDHGEGFSIEEKEKASDIFYRGDQSRQNDGHYGIGLFVARYAAQMHNGQLILENSDRTGGAKVIIALPNADV